MAEFLEEVLPINVRMGASYTDAYEVEIKTTVSGKEYRKLTHPFPVRSFHINFTLFKADMAERVLALYHRSYGMYAGFRVKCVDDFSTNNHVDAPTPTDWVLPLVSAGVYQLVKGYGLGAAGIAIGLPYRKIFKPVSGTTVVAIGGAAQAGAWTVSTTTGQVTFSANKTTTITAITQASSAVLTVASGSWAIGESIHISMVAGMTHINGLRALITNVAGSDLTVAINSSGFNPYTSGGTVNTRPQSGEAVTGGCWFDLPCRFNSKIEVTATSADLRDCGGIDVIELLNP